MNYLMLYYYMALAPIQEQPKMDTMNLHMPSIEFIQQSTPPTYYTFIGSNQASTSLLNQLSMKNVSGTILDVLFNLNENYRVTSAVKVAYVKVGVID